MRRLILATVFAVAALVAGGLWWWQSDDLAAFEGSGVVVVEQREVAGFAAIDLNGTGALHLSQGETETLTVQTDDNILPLVKTEVHDGTLQIWIDGRDHPRGIRPTRLSYEVGVKSLTAITVAGAANVEAGSLAAGDLRLNVSGSAQVALGELTATGLRVVSAGDGSFTVSGKVDEQEVTIDGSGDYQAKELASRVATVDINGAGHATIRVSEELTVSINGAGVVEYLGSPAVVQQVDGVGVVRRVTQ